jgi:hypothetical protein
MLISLLAQLAPPAVVLAQRATVAPIDRFENLPAPIRGARAYELGVARRLQRARREAGADVGDAARAARGAYDER